MSFCRYVRRSSYRSLVLSGAFLSFIQLILDIGTRPVKQLDYLRPGNFVFHNCAPGREFLNCIVTCSVKVPQKKITLIYGLVHYVADESTNYSKYRPGCTGSVGQRFILLLANHPTLELHAVRAWSRSAGKKYKDAVRCK